MATTYKLTAPASILGVSSVIMTDAAFTSRMPTNTSTAARLAVGIIRRTEENASILALLEEINI